MLAVMQLLRGQSSQLQNSASINFSLLSLEIVTKDWSEKEHDEAIRVKLTYYKCGPLERERRPLRDLSYAQCTDDSRQPRTY